MQRRKRLSKLQEINTDASRIFSSNQRFRYLRDAAWAPKVSKMESFAIRVEGNYCCKTLHVRCLLGF